MNGTVCTAAEESRLHSLESNLPKLVQPNRSQSTHTNTQPDLASNMAAPPLPVELVEEILLRLPPDDPTCLLRASLVCKSWGRAVSHPNFRRRLHELHRTPPVLGFFHDWRHECIPTTTSSFSLAAPDRRFWWVLDSRHGRALFLSENQVTEELLVWEPITGAQRRVSLPAAFDCSYPTAASNCSYPTAAVFCAADACDHRDCHGGPFHVVFVFTQSPESECDSDDEGYITSACVYSSETGTWGKPTSTHVELAMDFQYYSSVLVGRSLLYFMSSSGLIVEYDCARHSLRAFEAPEEEGCTLMLADDGGLGVNELTQGFNPRLKLWSMVASDDTDAQWVVSRVINLEKLLPVGALLSVAGVLVLGFAEGANVIFLNTVAGLFAIELQPERVKMVCDDCGPCRLIPVVSFYTPVPGNRHHDLPLLNATEVAGGQEKRGEEKTVEQVQQLIDNGFNAIEGTTSTPLNLSAMCSNRLGFYSYKLLALLKFANVWHVRM
ncbi:hypothetical protein ACQ4PT_002313 [Festuca glaucescens]